MREACDLYTEILYTYIIYIIVIKKCIDVKFMYIYV